MLVKTLLPGSVAMYVVLMGDELHSYNPQGKKGVSFPQMRENCGDKFCTNKSVFKGYKVNSFSCQETLL